MSPDANNPHPSAAELAAFDLGRLAPGDWLRVADHVAGCDACCAALEAVPEDSLVALLRASAATPGATPDPHAPARSAVRSPRCAPRRPEAE
jgi:hypothetical protein